MEYENLIYGLHAVHAIIEKKPSNIQVIYAQSGQLNPRLENLLAKASKNNIKIQRVDKKVLDQLSKKAKHQGLVAKLIATDFYTEADLPLLIRKTSRPPFILILDGVEDPHNLGACLRSANAAHVDVVIAPKDRAVGITPIVRKVASGAAETTPFIQVTNLARTLRFLKEENIWVVGAAGEAQQSLYETDLSMPLALVLGAEGKGMRRLTKKECDILVHIPMLGTVSSLNVSVSAGICLFEAIRQRLSQV